MKDEKNCTVPQWLLDIAPYMRPGPVDKKTFTLTSDEWITLSKLRAHRLLSTPAELAEHDNRRKLLQKSIRKMRYAAATFRSAGMEREQMNDLIKFCDDLTAAQGGSKL